MLDGNVSNLVPNNPYGGLGLALAVPTATLKAELFAMEKEGLTKIVSNPRIYTLDNEKAVVFQGEQIPFQAPAGDGATSQVSFKDAGIKLTVTPTVIGDGNIILNVEITKDSANYANAIGSNPPIDKREVQTKLIVRDNSVAVIGGVFIGSKNQSADKVPFLGDLPGIGKLFRLDANKSQRNELLIFLAPKIM